MMQRVILYILSIYNYNNLAFAKKGDVVFRAATGARTGTGRIGTSYGR